MKANNKDNLSEVKKRLEGEELSQVSGGGYSNKKLYCCYTEGCVYNGIVMISPGKCEGCGMSLDVSDS